jgi:chromosome partitioning protein
VQIFDQLWQIVVDRFGQGAVLALGVALWMLARLCWRWLQQAWCFLKSRHRALSAVRRVISRDGAREGKGVWRTKPVQTPDNYENMIRGFEILAVANLKGGVGKTTLAANIGAYFAKDWGKRVLLVDLDYQGSLSSMCFPAGGWTPHKGQDSLATKLISGDVSPDLIPSLAQKVELGETGGSRGHLRVVTAYYDLAQADNRILVEWLLRCRRKLPRGLRATITEMLVGKTLRTEDVRYRLAEALHAKAVRDAFDLVIIDCPPRLTTSEIQAFCASSHLLIPTIFDRASSEAVASLCEQVEILKDEGICPHLKYVGVVGTKWRDGQAAAGKSLQRVTETLADMDIGVHVLPKETFVPHTVQIVNNADDGIAYIVMPASDRQQVRVAIQDLAQYVAGSMGIPHPPPPASVRTRRVLEEAV